MTETRPVVTERPAEPRRPATEAEVAAAWQDPKLANVLYHDWESGSYDDKWSISFDQRCIDYARDRFSHVAGTVRLAVRPGAGTGLRHRVLPAQPQAGRRADRRLRHRPQPGHGRGGPAQRRAPRLQHRGTGRRRRVAALSGRQLRPGGRARGAAPHPGRRVGAARGAAGAASRRPVRVRRRADPVRRLRGPPAVPADLVGHHPGHPAALAAGLVPAEGGAGRLVPGGRAGGGGGPAHLRPGRAARAGRAGRRGGGGHPHRRADRGLVRLAGPYLRGGGAPASDWASAGRCSPIRTGSGCTRWTPRCCPGWCRPRCSTTSS